MKHKSICPDFDDESSCHDACMPPKYEMKCKMKAKMEHEMCQETEMEDCGMMLAHAYVPWQYYEKAFCPEEALMRGTLFPELYGVYRIPK